MFIEVNYNGESKILNTDFMIDIVPAGENKTNIIMHGGNCCQSLTIDNKFSEIRSRLIK